MADLLATIEHMHELTTYVTLLQRAQMTMLLRRPSSLTIFAPNEAAFAQLPDSVRAALEADPVQLAVLFAGHLVPGTLVAADLMMMSSVVTVGGRTLAVDAALGLRIDQAYLVQADILADNGVLHVIDAVLFL